MSVTFTTEQIEQITVRFLKVLYRPVFKCKEFLFIYI